MRPEGEIRAAIVAAVRENGPLALVDMVDRIGIPTTKDAVAHTLENSVRYGILDRVGSEKRAHCAKWVALYDVPNTDAQAHACDGGIVVLGSAIASWLR